MKNITLLLLLLTLTACARPAQHTPARRFYRQAPAVLIVLDAGHGGHDPGAIAIDKTHEEKALALATAGMVKRHLERMGYRVHLTRNDDTFVPLKERAGIANDLNATLFVSLHYNSSKSAEPHGIEVYRWQTTKEGPREADSQKAAELVLARVLHYTQANSRGVKQANFAVLRETEMPAILVEGGFLSNADELEKLKDPKYLNAIAWGVAQGVNDYFLDKYRPGC